MINWSVRQPPRFREPAEPRFKPCEGEVFYASTVDLPQIGLSDIGFHAWVDWERDGEGEITWTIIDLSVDEKRFQRKGHYAPHDVTLEAQFYRALHKAILAEHSTRIEERCAEEAGRDA